MSLWTALEPPSATVDPGGSTTVRLRVRNTGDVVDEYRFEAVGNIAPWVRIEPQVLRLYPGTTDSILLTFAPPRTPDAVAGPNPYAIRVTPTESPEATTVPEGNLTITPFTAVRAEIVPPTVKGRFRGKPKLAVDNIGNTKLTASIRGADNGDQIGYDIHPANVQIEPGRAAFVKTTLRPRQIIWFGASQQRPYTLDVTRSGADPVSVDGKYVQRGFLPRWVAATFCALIGLVIAFTMFWLTHKPQVSSLATPKASPAAFSTLTPTPAAPTTPVTTPPTTPATTAPQSSSGGGGGGTTKPKSVLPATRVLLWNTTTDKCADIPGSGDGQIGGAVNEFSCMGTDADNQLFDLEVRYQNQGPGGTKLFQIRNDKDRLCMDLPDTGPQPVTTKIIEGRCTGTTDDNQLWWLAKQPDGAYWIRNYASDNLCLDVSGESTGGDNTALTLFHCTDTDDQEWKIRKPDSQPWDNPPATTSPSN
ncbi:RICIN domain-containing protein [Actinacidiphila sp. bgisy144]|uniref:RICIN domain-containing protein n=1 Tax=unclassified Actinacidiphila TaxID=2995708 RepID=UPI003EBC293A